MIHLIVGENADTNKTIRELLEKQKLYSIKTTKIITDENNNFITENTKQIVDEKQMQKLISQYNVIEMPPAATALCAYTPDIPYCVICPMQTSTKADDEYAEFFRYIEGKADENTEFEMPENIVSNAPSQIVDDLQPQQIKRIVNYIVFDKISCDNMLKTVKQAMSLGILASVTDEKTQKEKVVITEENNKTIHLSPEITAAVIREDEATVGRLFINCSTFMTKPDLSKCNISSFSEKEKKRLYNMYQLKWMSENEYSIKDLFFSICAHIIRSEKELKESYVGALFESWRETATYNGIPLPTYDDFIETNFTDKQ